MLGLSKAEKKEASIISPHSFQQIYQTDSACLSHYAMEASKEYDTLNLVLIRGSAD
jgi:hypothetical protein